MSRNRQRGRRPHQPIKSKGKATLLALFGGIFGVHKFYLNESGAGMTYIFILFMALNIFDMPITFFLGLFDALRLAMMSQEEFDRRYNGGEVSRGTTRSHVPRQRAQRPTAVRTSRRTKRRNPFKISGVKKYEDFNLEGAITDFVQALDLAPDDGELHYYLARAYSLNEEKEKAFNHLSDAVKLGFVQDERIMAEDDLAFLRIQPEFDDFKKNKFTVVPASFRIKQEEEVQDDVLLSQLNKLAELRRKGLLSEKEFAVEREKILRR